MKTKEIPMNGYQKNGTAAITLEEDKNVSP